MEDMDYRCPECNGTNLEVAITTTAKLIQYGPGEYQTEITGDHEWGDDSFMLCVDCRHDGAVTDYRRS